MNIFLENRKVYNYPISDFSFNPSSLYPEYPWGNEDVSSIPNDVYDMLRNALYGMGYDKENFGKKNWNPLGDLIKPGQIVLLKPNWVSDRNKSFKKGSDLGLDCLVTHPSLIRAIIDYVVIALRGTGKVILGDAPMQGTDLDRMFKLTGYDVLFSFMNNKKVSVDICDFRKYRSVFTNGVITDQCFVESSYKPKKIDLGKKSLHADNDGIGYLYKVSDYDYNLTQKYHNDEFHSYEITEAVLLADVIINVPKPKTHRLAGITGAMKNFVGITSEKASLPHRVIGDKETGKGDAYDKKSILKMYMEYVDNKQTIFSVKGKFLYAKFFDLLKKSFYVLGVLSSGDKSRIGSWYGNDTIWRTVVDLNHIVNYADKKGDICEFVQRKILNIGDMIVCGEKEGPIAPSPKPLGTIMICDDMFAFDYALFKIMQLECHKIPIVHFLVDHYKYVLDKIIISNLKEISGKRMSDVKFPIEWKFESHSCWK